MRCWNSTPRSVRRPRTVQQSFPVWALYRRTRQYLTNLDFLHRQKAIPNVSNTLLPLISKIQINLESNTPITDSLGARKILEILPKEWGSLLHGTVDKVRSNVERPQPFALNDLASLLAASSETNSWTNAIYLRHLQQHLKKALAEKSKFVGFLPDQR